MVRAPLRRAARPSAPALLLAAWALALLPAASSAARAGELEIADGVVVKFGPNGELIVRDGLIVQGQVVFTSLNDDARLGMAAAAPGVPAPGDWRGVRLERSSPVSLTRLEGLRLLYGGASVPAFTLRSTTIPLNGLGVGLSGGVGLLAAPGTTSRLRELVLTGNSVGFQAEAGSSPVLEASVITDNLTSGAVNLGASPVMAGGVWWGHPSGPLDASDDRAAGGLFNPAGLGNPVSDGILYHPVAGAVPLFGLGITAAGGGVASQPIATFLLKAPTAVGARLSEDPSFAGVPFQPFTSSRTLVLTSGDGLKTVYAEFQAATGNTAVASTQVRLDTMGPSLSVTNVAEGSVLTRPLTVLADASDASGVAKVEFYLDGNLLFTDTTNSFSFDWDVRAAAGGPHVFSVIAVDNVGKPTRRDFNVAIAAAPPAAPAITSPASGSTTALPAVDVSGAAEPGVTISVYANGILAGRTISGGGGAWLLPAVAVREGENLLTALASDAVGTSAPSAPVLVTRDTGPPPPPAFFRAADLGAGTFRFDWLAAAALDVTSYNLYRSSSPFASRAQASLIVSGIAGLVTRDTPPVEGTLYYAVTATDVTNLEGEISNVVSVSVDRTPPAASVAASPSGVAGPGPVLLTVVVSEAIDGDPFLSVTPQGGSPVTVPLVPAGPPLTWGGTFEVLPSMASGPAAVAFSARDPAGNRGTQITSGGTIVLDTRGPQGTVAVTPMRPLGPGTFAAHLALDEPAAGTPVLRFLPPVGAPVALAPAGAGASWDADLVIDASMGDGPGRFELEAADAFGNATSGPIPGAGVDLDNTPPGVPGNFNAQTLPGGEIRLTWGAVADAASYVVDREDGDLIFGNGVRGSLPPAGAPILTDLPPADGEFAYVVRAVDAAGNASADSAPAGAVSDRTPPGDPSALALGIEGNAVRADWTPDLVDPAASFLLFRSTSPIATLAGLTPVQSGLTSPTALDRPPSDGTYHYAVAGVDAAGNRSGFAASGPFVFDQGDPVITVAGVADGQASNVPLTITFSAADVSLQSVTAALDGAPFTSGGVVSAEGDHVLVVDASDATGNASQKTIHFAVDATPPDVAVSGVADGGQYDASVTPVVAVTEARPKTTAITLDGAPFGSGTAVTADGSYTLAVHAEDLAGNVTDVTVAFAIDAAPPAVASLDLDVPENGLPTLTWPARPEPDVAGYRVARDGILLTPSPIPGTTFTDPGSDPFDDQVYAVTAVDAAGHESATREATLPAAGVSLGSAGTGGVLTRRYLDAIEVLVENPGASPLAGASVELTLKDGASVLGSRTRTLSSPIPAGGSAGVSAVFSTGEGAAATRTLEAAVTLPSEAGSRVRRLRSFVLNVREPSRLIEVFNDPMVLGATVRTTIRILNHGSARMQVRTSVGGGPTPDVEVRLKDADGNLLSSSRLDQRGGAVVTTGAFVFAEIPPGGSFLTSGVGIQVPSNAPASVVVEGAVLATHSDLLGTGDVSGPPLTGSGQASTGNPAYLAAAAPDRASYDQGETVQISGYAYDPNTLARVPNSIVKVGVNTRGFDRFLFAATDPNGDFVATFNPLRTEAGAYNVWAAHPAVTERSSQATFDILGLGVSPANVNLRMSQNSTFPIGFELKNVGETPLSGFAFDVAAGNGITASVDAAALPAVLGAAQAARLTFNVTADIAADLTNFATLQITTAEGIVRTLDVSLQLLPALPTVQTDPSFVEVSVGNGGIATRTVRVKNVGFAPLENVTIDLPATPWITLGVDPNLQPIPVGGFADVPVVFAPPASVTPMIYSDRFVVRSSNHVPYTENLFAIVTSSTTGDALFEVRNTENVFLPNASVWIQNLQVPTLTFTRSTDPNGQTLFDDLPSGPYQYRVQATGVEPSVGKFDVVPDQVAPISVIMNVVYVSIEWSVTPVIIEDRYDFVLTATFQTSVPAPVLVGNPPRFDVDLPPGATYVGEYTLTNHGLVALDDLRITPNPGAGLVLETLVTEVPRLGAMQSITVPFRLTRAASSSSSGPAAGGTAGPAPEGAAAGGGVSAQDGGPDPCAPVPASVHNIGIYVCLAGISVSTSFTISISAHDSLAQQLGLCDDECNPCDCVGLINDTAGAICDCLRGAATGDFDPCACMGAAGIPGDDVCDCITSGDPLTCLSLLGGEIAEAISIIDNIQDAWKCGLAIGKCLCKFLPEACDFSFGGGTVTVTGGPGGGCCGGGGYGGSYSSVSNVTGCN